MKKQKKGKNFMIILIISLLILILLCYFIVSNFKINKDGSFSVRCQYYWDNSFKGVGYFNINEF